MAMQPDLFIKKRRLTFKTILATCSTLACLLPAHSHAQLSIMGVLDTRAPFSPSPQRVSKQQPLKTPPPLYKSPPSDSFDHFPQRAESNEQQGPKSQGAFSAEEISFNRELGVITARGNVEIIQDDQVLIADTVSFNQNKDLVTASGNVQIIQPNGDVLFSEYVELTTDLKTGVANQLRMSLADHSLITAQRATRKEGRYTIAQDAEYSPCEKCKDDPDKPLTWKLSAKEISHDANQHRIEYSDVFFELYDIPILYSPYFSHPDPTRKRESGFLTPSFGSNSDLKGFVTAPYFFNISPSKDLTLEPTWYYSLHQGLLNAQYRQHLQNGELDLAGSLTYADGGAGATSANEEELRGHIDSSGNFDIDQTWRWGFDVNHASDETYIRRYNLRNESENSHLVSELYLEGFRKRNYMVAKLNTYQEQRDITTEDLQDAKLEYEFSHTSEPGSAGAYWKLDGMFYGINRKNETRTTRLSADTSWVLPYTSPTGDLMTLEANLITTGYYVSKFNGTNLTSEYSGTQARMLPSLSMQWRKPLSRTHMEGQVNEIFEPIVKVKAAPNVGRNYKIPNEDSQDFEFDDTNLFSTNRFSGLDKLEGGQRLDFGFNWGVYGQEGGYSELFVGQSYRFRDDKTYDTNSGHEDNISDVVGRVIVSPSDFLDVLYRFRLDKNNMSLNRSETELTIGPASTHFSLGHLFIEGTGQDAEYATREEINATLTNQISKYWYSKIDGRYRMTNPEGSVTYGGQIGYKDECTTIYFDARRNFSEDRDVKPNDAITLRIELKNLGGFGAL